MGRVDKCTGLGGSGGVWQKQSQRRPCPLEALAVTPFCVMTRGLLENVFAPGKLDDLFERHSPLQYHRQLLFSTCADLLTEVVLAIRPSLNAAYRAARKHGTITVVVKSLYEKLAGTAPQ